MRASRSDLGCRDLARLLFTTALVASTLSVVAPQDPARAVTNRQVPACNSSSRLRATELPSRIPAGACRLTVRTVVDRGLGVVVPPPGHTVRAVAASASGHDEIAVATARNGTVRILAAGPETRPSKAALAGSPCDDCIPPCEDDAFTLFSGRPRVRTSQPWYFNASTRPSYLPKRATRRAMKDGTGNITEARNNCDLEDPVGATARYKGGTGKRADFSSGVCSDPDRQNTVDFGKVGSTGALAVTCFWTATDPVVEQSFIVQADIRFKKSAPWTTRPGRNSCSNSYDIEGVMTHERGHAFGLGHPSAARRHALLTMYPMAFPCSGNARTLGLGDVKGLRRLY